MKSIYELIAVKRDGGRLTAAEIQYLVQEYSAGRIADYQFAALLMAAFINGLDTAETTALTSAMLHSGEEIAVPGLDRPLIDKHSTGGVGDKLSLIISPLAANLGIAVGMISGRGLGHTGGTLDKLEAIPGMKVFHTRQRFAQLLRRHHMAITGQTARIAPADKKIYALRDVSGTVESIPLIVASIMSKKLALKSDGIVFDVKTGSGAFIKKKAESVKLAKALLAVAQAQQLPARAIITGMDQPTGRLIGNFLEVMEAIEVLQGGGPEDTITLSVELCSQMLLVAGLESRRAVAVRRARQELQSGRAFETLCRYVKACGGSVAALTTPATVMSKTHKRIVQSSRNGYLAAMNTARIGFIAGLLGAGRLTARDRVDPTAGIELCAKIGDRVEPGKPLAVLYSRSKTRLDRAQVEFPEAVTIATKPAAAAVLIERRLAHG